VGIEVLELPALNETPSMLGVYLTDEVFLYRVVHLTATSGDAIVELEDCYGMDVVCVAATELHARALRLVTPADA
jgi:hypothetical protein